MLASSLRSNNVSSIGSPCDTHEQKTKQRERSMTPEPTNRDDNWSLLLQRVANQQDRKAFAELFEHFAPLIKGFCLAKPVSNQSSSLADELVQEVMIKVWQKAGTFDPRKASASTWIYTLARNCRIDLLRRGNRHVAQPLETDDIWDTEDEATPVTHLQRIRDADVIKAACSTLPPEQLKVINKVFVEGKTHVEAAQELSLPLGTVKSRVRLALKKLEILVGNRANRVQQ
ncbi:sigma-70 family RNA polymerase sigma factor [Halioxenophilus aromaticivorans]|uniref:Sigma-70 family RNA polymerase sigma factor n=1 Tax=Halioxenophilus aromaticivorans TaxID=1306992 RepID=A0AAV3TYD8_9ALTE